jgi:hypothetical protein
MALNVNTIIKNLSASRRRKIERRAASLIDTEFRARTACAKRAPAIQRKRTTFS